MILLTELLIVTIILNYFFKNYCNVQMLIDLLLQKFELGKGVGLVAALPTSPTKLEPTSRRR